MRIKKTNPTPDQLSPREYAAMLFIQHYMTTRRQAPTIREIAGEIGLCVSATHDLVKRLEEYGYIVRWRYHDGSRMARGIRVKRPV